MTMTDPIADMLTRIRNANEAKHFKVDIPSSKLKTGLAKILKLEGYIRDFRIIEDRKQGILRVYLKYGKKQETVLRGLKRVSKPGRRVFCKGESVPKVLNGFGTAIISTSSGILTDKECREKKVGGEVICYIW
ncbi:MAG TPA: 30S ribosomal protein S8 [Firmicutes bacterium]|nr:30S ribosomal protein S8 [Bacillota bacterium]